MQSWTDLLDLIKKCNPKTSLFAYSYIFYTFKEWHTSAWIKIIIFCFLKVALLNIATFCVPTKAIYILFVWRWVARFHKSSHKIFSQKHINMFTSISYLLNYNTLGRNALLLSGRRRTSLAVSSLLAVSSFDKREFPKNGAVWSFKEIWAARELWREAIHHCLRMGNAGGADKRSGMRVLAVFLLTCENVHCYCTLEFSLRVGTIIDFCV